MTELHSRIGRSFMWQKNRPAQSFLALALTRSCNRTLSNVCCSLGPISLSQSHRGRRWIKHRMYVLNSRMNGSIWRREKGVRKLSLRRRGLTRSQMAGVLCRQRKGGVPSYPKEREGGKQADVINTVRSRSQMEFCTVRYRARVEGKRCPKTQERRSRGRQRFHRLALGSPC